MDGRQESPNGNDGAIGGDKYPVVLGVEKCWGEIVGAAGGRNYTILNLLCFITLLSFHAGGK